MVLYGSGRGPYDQELQESAVDDVDSDQEFQRLLLTGTPLQNNLTELFALLQFIMFGMEFAGFKEFEGLLSGR